MSTSRFGIHANCRVTYLLCRRQMSITPPDTAPSATVTSVAR